MKKILTLVLLLPFLSMAQVGVNTTNPKAALDIESTNNGVLIPRVQLTSILDNITVINPNLGPLEISTLVYNIAAAGVVPNNVVAGFYYWNGTSWISIAGSPDWKINGNISITEPSIPTTYGSSTVGINENFIGTTDNNDVTFGTNNIERMRIKNTTGNVGIGIASPTEKLHVLTVSDANKSSVFGVAEQINFGVDYENIGVKGIGRGIPGWGFGVGIMGIGETANSYYATGVYAHLGTVAPVLPFTNQALFANGNNLGYAGIFAGGNVGIGTPTPDNLLHVNSATAGAVRIVDGTEANGRILTSDATGVGTWQSPSDASDHDWYEVGTTTPPDAITDDMFHTGNVAIGKNTADYPLEVNTTNFQFGMNNTYNNPTVTNTQKATINNNITDNTNDAKYGVINTVTNNSVTSAGVGVRNDINGNGTVFYGNSNYLTAGSSSNNADIIGVRNDIEHNANNSNIKGVFNIFRGTAGNINYFNGVQNDFRVSGLRKTGVENIFNANTDGFNVGLYNSLSANLALNDQYGIWNNFDTGPLTNADNYGVYNVFTGLGSSSKIGNYTRIDSDGDGQHTAAVQLINGSAVGTGAKYGTFTQISNSAGGTHYGIHSTVLKPGATNFAGYFLGNVGIGTTTANTYTFPPSRGTNGQIMQTDGTGNVTWQSPSGASDHDWYEVGTTLAPNAITDNIFHTGNVAIGKNTADYPLEVNTTNFQFGMNNTYNNPTVTNTQKATINNNITDDTNDAKYGVINTVTNNSATSTGVGVRNDITGNGTVFYANSNYVTAGTTSNNSEMIGVRNEISNSSSGTITRGMYNIFNGSGGNFNTIQGIQNDFRVTALQKTGTYNVFNANIDGANAGLINALNSDMPLNNQTGVVNSFNTGALTTGSNIGVGTNFIGNGSGAKTGSETTINSNGNGEHSGAVQIISGSPAGTGTKYGTRTVVDLSAGGTHYGIHSTVLKPGATNFAGYFLGNVGIGTTTANTYTFPPSRGTNGQIMQTDGIGNVTWQTPLSGSAWLLNGNTTITNPANPVTYGTSTIGATENFIGTTDNNDVTFGTNRIERMRIKNTTGNVGIGIASPTEKLHVLTVSDANKSSVFGVAEQINSGVDYENIGVKGIGRGIPGWGFGAGIMGIGETANSYFATGVYAHLGTVAPVLPFTNQALIANGNNLGYAGIFAGGNVGIGTPTPSNLLHVNSASSGAVRIVDGTQAAGRVLTSNATGVGTWQSPGIENIIGTLDATGVSLPFSLTTNFVQTNSSITLPPGRYAVNVTMLLARNSSTLPSPDNSFFWVRSTFSDSNAPNPVSSPDIVGSSLASGNFGGTSVYAMLTGTIIINNTTAGNKIYYYVGGQCVTFSTTETLTGFGSTSWAENSIIAYRLN